MRFSGVSMTEKSSIKNRYRKLITWIIFSFALITCVVFYVFANYQVNEKYKLEALGVIELTNSKLETTFKDSEMGLLSLQSLLYINDIKFDDQSQNHVFEYLSAIKNSIHSSSTVFVGDKHGNFYLSPERFVAEDYDPRQRAWYISSLENQNTVNWTEPYVDHGTGEFTLTASKYIGDDAVIGVDILLSEISSLVNQKRIGNDGYITLVNQSGVIIASPDKNALAKNWDDYYTSEIKASDFNTNEALSDSKYKYFTKVNESLGITIVASVNQREIFSSLSWIILLISLMTFTLIFIAERFSIKASDKIVKPIFQLVETMEEIEEGDYNQNCDISTDTIEISKLVSGFNSMIGSINEKNVEMQALYEELYASEEALQDQFDRLYENAEFIKKSEERYRSIFEASKEGLWELFPDGTVAYLTPHWYKELDLNISGSTIQDWMQIIHPEDRSKVEFEHLNIKNGQVQNYRIEYRVIKRNGEIAWIEAVGISRYDEENQYISTTGSHQDITIRKSDEIKIREMAYHDPLTHLFNRRYFELKFQKYLDLDGTGSLLLLDIDNFKYINDIYGHTFGDEILKMYADRLRDVFADNTKSIIARFSGNEFIILLEDYIHKDDILTIINDLLKSFEAPYKFNSKSVKLTTSIGITIFPKDGSHLGQLIQNSDIAMFHARRVSKKTFHFFENEIKANALNEMKIESHMRSAIEDDEFEVYYQPLVDSNSGVVKGFEALVRWNSKALGFIYPDKFIDLAEKNGLIVDIGNIVFDKACAFISKLNTSQRKQYSISINISVMQLMEDHFANHVLSIIEKYDIPKHLVRLEITESIMLESNENIIAKLFYLKNQNVGISLDDFGTGYSSFKNLIRLPLSGIKIDKAIMKDSITKEHVFTLLSSIVDFAHKTNIDVVAEGIENFEYLTRAQALKVDFAQGYYFSKPVSEAHVIDLLEALNGSSK